MADLFQNLILPVKKADGTVLIAGTVTFYSPGLTGDDNKKTVYTDQAGTIASANPVTLDASGTAAVYGIGKYHIVIKDSGGVTIYDYDYITPQQTGNIIYQIQEVHVATAGQTIFTLTNAYNPSTLSNGIAVYVNGHRIKPADYTETDSTTITFDTGRTLNDEVLFVINFYDTGTEAVSVAINLATTKATPLLADQLALLDSADSDTLKRSTIAQSLRAITQLASKTTPVVADKFSIIDTEDSNLLKLMTIQQMVDLAVTAAVTAALAESKVGTLNMKIVDLGDWNMDTSSAITVTHGITDYKKIRSADAWIRDDADSVYYNLAGVSISGTPQGCVASIGATTVTLQRTSSGSWDSTSFDSTSYNRGWVVLWYID